MEGLPQDLEHAQFRPAAAPVAEQGSHSEWPVQLAALPKEALRPFTQQRGRAMLRCITHLVGSATGPPGPTTPPCCGPSRSAA